MSEQVSWRYVAEARDGRTVRGVALAASEAALATRLRADGLLPVTIQRAGGMLSLPGEGRFRARDQTRFVRSLADLVTAGIPVRDALSMLARRERQPVLAAFLGRLETAVAGGESLTAALQRDPVHPPRLLIAVAAAGEASGRLGEGLDQLGRQMAQDDAVRAEVISQLVYPVMLLGLIALTLLGLSYLVLPQFETLFDNASAAPPPETALVLGFGAAIRAFGPSVLVIGLVLALLVNRLLARNLDLGERLAGWIPLVRTVRRRLDHARYCRTLGLLLESGQPLARAEPVARMAVASPVRRDALQRAGARVRNGQALAASLQAEQALPDDLVGFVDLGEKTGRLAPMLSRAAEMEEDDARQVLKRSVELLGPVLTAILGLFVAVVIASVMSGVLSLNEVVY